MVVILPNCALTVEVRAHPWKEDARGVPIPSADDKKELRGPYPGAALEQADGTWRLRVDPRCWPMREGDRITDGTRTWIAANEPMLNQVPGAPDVDFIRVTGTIDPPKVL